MLMLDFIAIGAIVGLILIEVIPDRPQRILWGFLMFFLGLAPFLYLMQWISFDIYSYNLTRFLAIFIVIVVGELLFVEGLKEQNKFLKITSMIFGIVIILWTTIPWMREFNAISFDLPVYAPVIDFFMYLITGILTIIGGITVEK